MSAAAAPSAKAPNAAARLLSAALGLIRTKGYHATSVDDLCAAAGVTKGAFFHHFASKEALAVAAANHWSQITGALFAAAPYHALATPLDRVLGYIDFRTSLIEGPVEAFTCLVGTMVQEVFAESPAIRAACEASISGHARTLEADIATAMAEHGVGGVSAASLALHTQAVLQGAFILAKAQSRAEVARDHAGHLKRYFQLLFQAENKPVSSKIAPCLWFNGQAEEAARFYTALFPDAAIGAISRYGGGGPFPAGTALMVEFSLAGQRFQALNGGPQFNFSEAVSLSVACRDAAEVDCYWGALTGDGGTEGRCGWLKDRFGVSWQIVPDGLGALLSDPDRTRAGRAMQAMMGMKKLDLAAMRAAMDGETA